jgi:hypothetical protein
LVREFASLLTDLAHPEQGIRAYIKEKETEWMTHSAFTEEIGQRFDTKIRHNLRQLKATATTWLSFDTIHSLTRQMTETFEAARAAQTIVNKRAYFKFTENGDPEPGLLKLCLAAEELVAGGNPKLTPEQLHPLITATFAWVTEHAPKDIHMPKKAWSARAFQAAELAALAELRTDMIMSRDRITKCLNFLEYSSLPPAERMDDKNVSLLSPRIRTPTQKPKGYSDAETKPSIGPLQDYGPIDEDVLLGRARFETPNPSNAAQGAVYQAQGNAPGFTAANPQARRPTAMRKDVFSEPPAPISEDDEVYEVCTPPPKKRKMAPPARELTPPASPQHMGSAMISDEELASLSEPWAKEGQSHENGVILTPLQRLLKGEKLKLKAGQAALHHIFSKDKGAPVKTDESLAKSTCASYSIFTRRSEETKVLLDKEAFKIDSAVESLRKAKPSWQWKDRVEATIDFKRTTLDTVRHERQVLDRLLREIESNFRLKIEGSTDEQGVLIWTALARRGEKAAEMLETDRGDALVTLLTELQGTPKSVLIAEGRREADPIKVSFASVRSSSTETPAPQPTPSPAATHTTPAPSTPRTKAKRSRQQQGNPQDEVPGTATWLEGYTRMTATSPCINCRQAPHHRIEDCPNALTHRIRAQHLREKVGVNIRAHKAGGSGTYPPPAPVPVVART